MNDNSYLGEVLQQQKVVESALKRKVRADSTGRFETAAAAPAASGGGRAVDYRITGWWRWKTVVVPPNVYVVHTRARRDKPVTIGMGRSFSYNPYKDAFIVIPAAMQTIVINARCICMERQGILVQAYVQWIIDDIETAYQKLELSDAEDPMRIVNVQLREQAEAAIKDKVATMRIDEVLADKQPIIEELTTRLRAVAEGDKKTGLGLKIVTVQIKEAVVSSTQLWENLQKPFRAERERLAQMADLDKERQIAARKSEIEREAYDRAQAEAARRAQVELDNEMERLSAEVAAVADKRKYDQATAERERAQAQSEMALTEERSVAAAKITERELHEERARREIENLASDAHVLIKHLPEIAARLPQPKELKTISIGADGPAAQLTGLYEGLMAIVKR
jgi:regulator of protease activity HflC (stomatin/prohibitin superfamily)